MRLRYDTEDEALDIAIKGSIRIDTGKGSITVSVHNAASSGGFQAIVIEGDKHTTWLKFDGKSLL